MIHVAQVQGRVPFKEAQYSQATQSFKTLFFGVSPKTRKGTQRTAPTALLTGPFQSSSGLSQSCSLELLSSYVPRIPSLYPPPQACQAFPSCPLSSRLSVSASCLLLPSPPLPPSPSPSPAVSWLLLLPRSLSPFPTSFLHLLPASLHLHLPPSSPFSLLTPAHCHVNCPKLLRGSSPSFFSLHPHAQGLHLHHKSREPRLAELASTLTLEQSLGETG